MLVQPNFLLNIKSLVICFTKRDIFGSLIIRKGQLLEEIAPVAHDITALHDQSDKILNATISQRNLLDLAIAEKQTFSLISRITLLLNRSLTINLFNLPVRLIKQ